MKSLLEVINEAYETSREDLDSTFVVLENLTKWSNKNEYIKSLNSAFENMSSKEIISIEQLLKNDFEYLDKNFKKEKSVIIDFLSFMYPAESFKKTTDDVILEYMTELSELYKKYYKNNTRDIEDFIKDYCHYFRINPSETKVDYGPKYIKFTKGNIVKMFIDYEGNIYKPASYARPAKGVRGTIYDEFADVFDELGNPYYLK